MLKPQMINSVVKPILKNSKINAAVLGVEIISAEQFYDKNIVKIVHDMKNQFFIHHDHQCHIVINSVKK